MINQCDGCLRNLPVEDGIHWYNAIPYMVCTKDRYVENVSRLAQQDAEEYDDSLRYDEMATAEDYNRWEEEQVFQDREWDNE